MGFGVSDAPDVYDELLVVRVDVGHVLLPASTRGAKGGRDEG